MQTEMFERELGVAQAAHAQKTAKTQKPKRAPRSMTGRLHGRLRDEIQLLKHRARRYRGNAYQPVGETRKEMGPSLFARRLQWAMDQARSALAHSGESGEVTVEQERLLTELHEYLINIRANQRLDEELSWFIWIVSQEDFLDNDRGCPSTLRNAVKSHNRALKRAAEYAYDDREKEYGVKDSEFLARLREHAPMDAFCEWQKKKGHSPFIDEADRKAFEEAVATPLEPAVEDIVEIRDHKVPDFSYRLEFQRDGFVVIDLMVRDCEDGRGKEHLAESTIRKTGKATRTLLTAQLRENLQRLRAPSVDLNPSEGFMPIELASAAL